MRKISLILICGALASFVAKVVFAENEEFSDCEDCPKLLKVPAGSFELRNAPWGPGHPHDEGFFYLVTFSDSFDIGKYEVTVREWGLCVLDGKCADVPSSRENKESYPVTDVTWSQASSYTKWLTEKTGFKYRLPSNAEWEYAARAGLGMNRYFDIPMDELCQYANTFDQSVLSEFPVQDELTPCDDGFTELAPIGSFTPNLFGLHDTIGNVSEWTEDCASPDWRGAPPDGKSWLDGDCSLRGYRGGSYLSNEPYYLVESHRFRYPGLGAQDLGFRVLRE